MAAYFHGSSEIQSGNSGSAPSDHHGIQTLYLMNPSFLSSYSDQNQQESPGNMLFCNTLNPGNIHHAPPINHNLLGISLQATAADVCSTENRNYCTSNSEFVPAYNIWGSFDQSSVDASGLQLDASGFRRPVVASPTRQGLSLTLSSQQVQPHVGSYDNNRPISHKNDHSHIQAMMSSGGDDRRVPGNSPSSVSAASNGGAGVESTVFGSKYLQPAQELLDEVVNVAKAIKGDTKEKMKTTKESDKTDGSIRGGNDDGGESCTKQGIPLTTAQRQELQMKKAKLVNMLDEVEQRYKQYHNHIQITVSSFEQAAGSGAAKSYTDLALRRITKQFRCLNDAVSKQIKATSKSLGEEECLGVKIEGSRLRFLNQQLWKQRDLQQFGMVQNNGWRPQRGLPERAVTVLRAWLFEHFLHPYPKDSDKQILAKQTGLTRSQVSNWFINARVRLWKPMVEEMYLEEIKEQAKNDGTEEDSGKDVKKDSCSIIAGDNITNLQSSKSEKPIITTQNNASPTEFSNSAISVSPMAVRGGEELSIQPGFTLIRPSELEGISQSSPKKSRSSNNSHEMQNSPSSILSMEMEMKQSETDKEMINTINFGDGDRLISSINGGFGGYSPIGEVGRLSSEQLAPRFGANNNVSLTLGLQHCENLTLSGSHQQNFFSNQNIQLGRRLEIQPNEPDFFGVNTTQNSHPMADFENIDTPNRKRFVLHFGRGNIRDTL